MTWLHEIAENSLAGVSYLGIVDSRFKTSSSVHETSRTIYNHSTLLVVRPS
jgi:hypothetical protein